MLSLEEVIGYKFRNSLLLAEALTHPSMAYETQKPHFDNQRLEFLGDAVIQLVLTEKLYQLFPGFSEGRLTKLRARLVSREALHCFANEMNLGSYIMMGKGEESTGGRSRASTLADAFESVLGAVYLDGGLENARATLDRICSDAVKLVAESPEEKNPKGQLQEVLQAISPEGPQYQVIREEGPDHQKSFTVEVHWKQMPMGEGIGNSKKNAEINAARNALKKELWKELSK
ncbi:ribonuclease III [Verrucomicrobiaceae bacterium R5-34]|uniref:Ribonuclease 3 n=1 Tax=Oceaniferula flava TaxID=2800421 RepID=A0AAE2SBP0_9BACT|nr:ribonuclease III [Oceaniferula flavus]MBK1829313.1 ribonuclease III [Verrucomicrobiaceae bacterium R5-34]MBK1853540.1 ribonuclease III [Oceaniferula flavus]MBM1134845.1 ribonuclease III [Oceaniferula flavus]